MSTSACAPTRVCGWMRACALSLAMAVANRAGHRVLWLARGGWRPHLVAARAAAAACRAAARQTPRRGGQTRLRRRARRRR
eukprot:1616969-Prymnesium_polylepis.1